MTKSKAVSFGAATVVNAMACGRGAAFGLGLQTEASVKLDGSLNITATIEGSSDEDTSLMAYCMQEVFEYFNVSYGARVRTKSSIPVARGLKSSSAAANAVVLAACDAVLTENPSFEMPGELEIVHMGIKASVKANVTVTGALDDAAACFFGGFVLTDNSKMAVVESSHMPQLQAIVFVPEKKAYSADVDISRIRVFSKEALAVWETARRGMIYPAMNLNGLLYSSILGFSPEVAIRALEKGALAAGLCGKGPSVVALAEDDVADEIVSAWASFEGEVICTHTNNRPAFILK